MEFWLWGGFVLFVLVMLALDLGVFHRRDEVMSVRSALLWTGFWIALGLSFSVLVYFVYEQHWAGMGLAKRIPLDGKTAVMKYLTGYLIEKSLSIDNIAVIAVIFGSFKIPAKYQHRVLFYGILGAILLRGLMIGAGVALIQSVGWIVYVFGAFLIFTAVRMFIAHYSTVRQVPMENKRLVRLTRRIFQVTSELSGHDFFVRLGGALHATPLFLVLVLVEGADVIFAVDSIPAILAVTDEGFLVFTSNIFAILGLRSLYFALANLMDRFRFLTLSLVAILAYVGAKMLVSHHLPIPAWLSLVVIVGLLGLGILASVCCKVRTDHPG